MKLMHISDLHIGKKLFETSMLEDQRYILNRILDLLDDEPEGATRLADHVDGGDADHDVQPDGLGNQRAVVGDDHT